VVQWAAPLFLCLMLVEIADPAFAIDSVPAWLSLSVTAGLLAGGVHFSLWTTRGGAGREAAADRAA
jgi:predicted tellurium resistance membrane protein TerC